MEEEERVPAGAGKGRAGPDSAAGGVPGTLGLALAARPSKGPAGAIAKSVGKGGKGEGKVLLSREGKEWKEKEWKGKAW